MAHRLSPARPGVALGALLVLAAVTAAWWALALWPAGPVEPEWLERTRAACFGSPPGGLPNTGGWLVLIGQPLGMFGWLFVVWPVALREDIHRAWATLRGRIALSGIAAAVLIGAALAGLRVGAMHAASAPVEIEPEGNLTVQAMDLEGLALIDQHGAMRSLESLAQRPALLTMAFAHCQTICPTIVRDLQRIRSAAGHDTVPLVIITVDPWRDTPARLATIATSWGLAPHDVVLSGDIDQVQDALDRLGVARTRNQHTGDVIHRPVSFRLEHGRVVRRLDGGWGNAAVLLR